MPADGLFVYGTLREGARWHSWLLRTSPAGMTRAFTPGRLFHLPSARYPVVVIQGEPADAPPGPGWVVGTFVGYEDEDDLYRALDDLDQLEGVDDGLFVRLVVPVILDSGHHYQAWAYVFPEDRLGRLTREGVELPGGDWRDYF